MPETERVQSAPQTMREISRAFREAGDLAALLRLLSDTTSALPDVDGVLINLHHPESHSLICRAAHLPPPFSCVESTYQQYTFPDNGEDANAAAFSRNRTVSLTPNTLARYPGSTRLRFERWQMQHLVILPLQASDPSLTPAGTLMLFSQQQPLQRSTLNRAKTLIAKATPLIRLHLRIAHWEERARAIHETENDLLNILQFVAEIGNLTAASEIYPRIQHEFMRRFDLDWAAVLMVEQGELRCLDTRFLDQDAPWAATWTAQAPGIAFALDSAAGASADTICRNRMLYFDDVPAVYNLPMSETDRAVLETMRAIQSFSIIPIRKNGQATGVLWLGSMQRKHALTLDDLTLIQHLCDFLGAVIDNAHTYTLVEQQRHNIAKLLNAEQSRAEALDELASRDRLTGLFNFGSFEVEAARQITESQLNDTPLSLIMCDIDHFKRFNDTFGHAAGNEILKEVAQRISKTARDADYVVRFGGEEFAVLLPRCNLDAAYRLAERIRNNIATRPFVVDGVEHTITMSLGCAQYTQALTRLYDFTEKADTALYVAKRGGRNRVEIAPIE